MDFEEVGRTLDQLGVLSLWLKHHVYTGDFSLITPCLGAAILCEESVLGGHHLVAPHPLA